MAKAKTTKTTPKKATKKSTSTKKTTAKKPATKKPTTKKTTAKKPTTKKPTTAKTTLRTTKSTKPKSTSKKTEKRDEFRTNKANGHPSYIYAKVGKSYKYIGITHAKITNNTKNIPLEKNPEPGNKSQAYARPSSQTDKVKRFKKEPLKGWKLSQNDKKKIKPIMK